ncbi:MAG TPA: hypothetical protein VKB16_20325 [Beijerinckiaceae bacterium]|nr:hypothetical protein [Beijerinckiaceae bacterium]
MLHSKSLLGMKMSADEMTTSTDPSMMNLLDHARRRASLHRPVHGTVEEREDEAGKSVHEQLSQIRALTPPGGQIDSVVLLRAIRDE